MSRAAVLSHPDSPRPCPRCGEAVDPDEFMDAVTRAEWEWTGLCAGCQTVAALGWVIEPEEGK